MRVFVLDCVCNNMKLLLLTLCIGATYCQYLNMNECTHNREKHLYACKNVLGTFPDMDFSSKNIPEQLECLDCEIKIFSNMIYPYENKLFSFNVSESGIEYISEGAFKHFKGLRRLYLQDNKIVNISVGAFSGLRTLYELHLENNQISDLYPGFLDNVEVSAVTLSNNKIKSLPGNGFTGSLGVLSLDLENNMIRMIHKEAFNGLETIEYLVLKDNQLCHIPVGVFSYIKTLRHLNLEGNKLRTISSGAFSGLSNLQTLSLANNELQEFDGSFLIYFNDLFSLDISGNGMYYIDAFAINDIAPSIKIVYLDGNIYTCKQLVNIIKMLKKQRIQVECRKPNFELPNINGIVCAEDLTTDKISYEHFLKVVKTHVKSNNVFC